MGFIGKHERGVRIVTRFEFGDGRLERVGEEIHRRPFELIFRYRDGTLLVKDPPADRELAAAA